MRVESKNKHLDNLEGYKTNSLRVDAGAVEAWQQYMRNNGGSLPSIVVWEDQKEVIVGHNIVEAVKTLSAAPLEVWEKRRLRQYSVVVLYIEEASYDDTKIFRVL